MSRYSVLQCEGKGRAEGPRGLACGRRNGERQASAIAALAVISVLVAPDVDCTRNELTDPRFGGALRQARPWSRSRSGRCATSPAIGYHLGGRCGGLRVPGGDVRDAPLTERPIAPDAG